MPASDKVSIELLRTDRLPPAAWDEIWTLTAEFYDAERDYATIQRQRQERQQHIR